MTAITIKRNLRAMSALFQRDIIKVFRDRGRLLGSFMQPLLFLVLFGFGFEKIIGVNPLFKNLNYIQFIFPGIIGTNVLGLAISQGVGLSTDRQFGFLKEVLVAPISRLSITIGKLLSGVVQGWIQITIIMLFTPFLGLRFSLEQLILLYIAAAFLALAATAAGILLASSVKSAESFQFVFQAIIFPIFFLSGTFFPVTTGPITMIGNFEINWLLWLSRLSPLTYAVDWFRHILYSEINFGTYINPQTGAVVDPRSQLLLFSNWADFGVLFGVLVLFILLATWRFSRMEV